MGENERLASLEYQALVVAARMDLPMWAALEIARARRAAIAAHRQKEARKRASLARRARLALFGRLTGRGARFFMRRFV